MKKCWLICYSLFFLLAVADAQQPSLSAQLAAIEKTKDDSAKVNRLNELATANLASDPGFVKLVIQKSIALSQKINYDLGASVANGIQGSMLIYEMKLDSALLFIDKAWQLVESKKDIASLNQQASTLQKYGAVLQQKQLYDSAIKKYLQATELYRQTSNENLSIVGFYNIAVMYGFLKQPDKALNYARQVNRIANTTKDPEFLVRSFIALGDAFTATQTFDSVYFYAQKGLAQPNVSNNPFVAGKFHQLTGIYFLNKTASYDSAIQSFVTALQYFEKINLPYEKALIYQNMTNAFLQKKDFANVIRYGNNALELCRPLGMYELQSKVLADMAKAAEYAGSKDSALRYLQEFIALRDTLEQLNKRQLVNDLEEKYQSQRKEALLQSQQNSIYKKNVLNYILMGSAIILLLLFILGYYNYKQKQKLQQQRIAELETQQQLMAAEAVLKGEEQERTRLAKDLHDGLGGMLSGIKYSFNNMKGNMVMTETNQQAFERGMDMLDSSIQEMRRVAHNMMPEVLLKFGLDTALKDFCNDISKTGVMQISYQSLGMKDVQPSQTTAITIYRIVQELINNSLKHSGAVNAIVQLSYQNNHLSLTVEDDGKGFDTALLTAQSGIGWANIKSRIEFLKGQMDIQSQKNKGTSVHIEIDIS
ncbi:MAG: tetratricopeptide repeat protein [Sphingobacteriales bacterium]|nr:MAG: tetratricopeptide repeat protein [Sphingobacteriales bacterium]